MKNKIVGLITIVILLSLLSVTQVFAAPPVVGEGTITAVVMETDLGVTTVLVSLEDSNGLVHTVRLSLESAVAEGLVIPDAELIGTDVGDILYHVDPFDVLASGVINSMAFVAEPPPTVLVASITDATTTDDYTFELETAVFNFLIIVDETKIGEFVTFDPFIILESSEYGKAVSKVGTFFGSFLGVDYATLQAYHDDGYGFGEITQAAWMTYLLGGDGSLLEQILAAKESGDFSGIILADGSTVTSWGQLRKAVLTDPKQNLGQIISGKADPLTTAESDSDANAESSDANTNNGNGNSSNNNGKSDDEKTNNGVGNTKDKSEKTNNGKKP